MKKLFAFLAVCSIVMTPASVSAETMRDVIQDTYMQFTDTFPDVSSVHPNFAAVAMLVEDEVIGGYPDGTFKPDGNINRAELMKMVVEMYYPKSEETALSSYESCFTDVTNEWFAYYVCKGKSLGWVDGYPDGSFKPGNNVNRVEAIKIILNSMIEDELWPSPTDAELALTMPADSEAGAWYMGYLQFSVAKELLDGQHVTGDEQTYFYKPGDYMTRKEVAEMIYRTYVYMVERLEYVDLIATTSCFQTDHLDMTEDDAYALWIDEVLTPFGYTEEDADWLSDTYTTDDVLTLFKLDAVEYLCGDKESVDMTKWEGFQKFAR
ncbi:hypothetical protein C0416_03560 [bacterium]|nr:hypothetical protein [bacterium]